MQLFTQHTCTSIVLLKLEVKACLASHSLICFFSSSNILVTSAANHKHNRASDSGPSEKGTLYVIPTLQGTLLQVHIIYIYQEPPRRGQSLYQGHTSTIYVPKVSLVWRLYCIIITLHLDTKCCILALF